MDYQPLEEIPDTTVRMNISTFVWKPSKCLGLTQLRLQPSIKSNTTLLLKGSLKLAILILILHIMGLMTLPGYLLQKEL